MSKLQSSDETQSRARLTLDLSNRMATALNNYAQKHGLTKAEALRTAVELLMAADDAAEDGLRIGAWGGSENQRVEREFVGFSLR